MKMESSTKYKFVVSCQTTYTNLLILASSVLIATNNVVFINRHCECVIRVQYSRPGLRELLLVGTFKYYSNFIISDYDFRRTSMTNPRPTPSPFNMLVSN